MPEPFIVQADADLPAELRRPVVAIGNFDGLHRGHRTVVDAAISLAARVGSPAALLTFEPHPAQFFQSTKLLFRLTDAQAKAHLAERMGLDGVLVLPFDEQLAALPADAFLDRILGAQLNISGAAVGHDFHFGKGRGGTPAILEAWGKTNAIPVAIVEKLHLGDAAVSSSAIRSALASGDIAVANHLLGYRWFVTGLVVHGDKRGRDLGYPTANVVLAPDCGLRHGIYAVRMKIGGRVHGGVASFGRRPTFDDGAPRLETFVFDFSGDIYGQPVAVEFIAWIRAEEKFSDIGSLIAQMDRDAAEAKSALVAIDDAPSMIG